MFKVDEDKKEIHITRGDKCAITLTLTNGSFDAGDTIKFRAYERKKLNELPVISKEFNITEDCDTFDIEHIPMRISILKK